MGVLALWRYPVKAMLGQLLDAVEIGLGGCAGDRRWIVVDRRTGERIANKRGPTDPRLRACRAELGEDGLRVTLPGGEVLTGAEIEAALSDLLERPVRLEEGAHHDFAPIHLISSGTLAHLRRIAPESDWDVRRFRPNVLLEDDAAGFGEDGLLGGRLRGPSGLELSVSLPTPRCVVPTRRHEDLPADPRILRTLVREHRVDLGPVGRQGCAGAYADVARTGELRVGQRLAVGPPATSRDEAIAASLARIF